ncbi:MAG: ribose-phosphate diphosphokinase [Patescibacteria group bacterium]|nr:ribose-phosphate diphosphokinase [Patescibacteria group bacterium]MDD4304414.1 ribose-phosphate diphosphokinase [Patescibacteria group bacterium]MDD4695437.1 ribose-phosphate diphosphokinase [Patescibacteria group bacterium]
MRNDLKIITGTGHPDLAIRICEQLSKITDRNIELVPTILKRWPNGELYARVKENVRGCDVFIVQSMHCQLPYSTIEEIEFLIDCIRDSARRITIIASWIGYAKQDRKTISRETRAFRVVCKRLSRSGADRVLLCDVHNSATAGLFDIPVDSVYIMRILIEEMQSEIENSPNQKPILCSPDLGSAKRVQAISAITGISDVCVVQKIQKHDSKEIDIEKSKILGNVRNKDVHIFDDMIQSFKTMKIALDIIRKHNPKSITLHVVHPDFIDGTINNLVGCCADKIIITDTIPVPNNLSSKVQVLDPSLFLAKCIFKIHEDESLSEMFIQY